MVEPVRDLLSRADIALVVDRFYAKAIEDEQMGYLFEGLDLMNHLPVIYDFWENILWRTGTYKGGMMYKHLMLHSRKPLQLEHFQRWLELFVQTMDEHYQGPRANTMKQPAYSVARVSQQNHLPIAIQDASNETSAKAGSVTSSE